MVINRVESGSGQQSQGTPKRSISGTTIDEAVRLAVLAAAVGSMPGPDTDLRSREDERRRTRRHALRMPVTFAYNGIDCTAITGDVSLGGIFIETEEPPPFGARIEVRMNLKFLAAPVSVSALVRWVEEGLGVGVQFVSLRPLVVWALQQEIPADVDSDTHRNVQQEVER